MTAARIGSLATHGLLRTAQLAQTLLIRSPRDAILGDYRRDVYVRGHIEGRVHGLSAVRRHGRTTQSRDLVRRALLDRYAVAGSDRQIYRARRRGDVERHAVLSGQHRELVSTDLVGHVAVGGDPVRADDDCVDRAP